MIEEGMGSPDPEERAITLLVTELRGTPPSDWDARLGAALLDHGVWLIGTLADMSRSDAFAEQVLERSWQLAVEWLRGRELSGRADEPELRAALARRRPGCTKRGWHFSREATQPGGRPPCGRGFFAPGSVSRRLPRPIWPRLCR
jgi:hypothetical protein